MIHLDGSPKQEVQCGFQREKYKDDSVSNEFIIFSHRSCRLAESKDFLELCGLLCSLGTLLERKGQLSMSLIETREESTLWDRVKYWVINLRKLRSPHFPFLSIDSLAIA